MMNGTSGISRGGASTAARTGAMGNRKGEIPMKRNGLLTSSWRISSSSSTLTTTTASTNSPNKNGCNKKQQQNHVAAKLLGSSFSGGGGGGSLRCWLIVVFLTFQSMMLIFFHLKLGKEHEIDDVVDSELHTKKKGEGWIIAPPVVVSEDHQRQALRERTKKQLKKNQERRESERAKSTRTQKGKKSSLPLSSKKLPTKGSSSMGSSSMSSSKEKTTRKASSGQQSHHHSKRHQGGKHSKRTSRQHHYEPPPPPPPRPPIVLEDETSNEAKERNDARKYVDSIKSVDRPLLFFHIPKTAGTAIEYAAGERHIAWGSCLFNHKPKRDICQYPEGEEWPNHVGWWHIPSHFFPLANVNPYSGADLFGVVRDPYDRMVSEYYYICTLKVMDWRPDQCDRAKLKDKAYMNSWLAEKIQTSDEYGQTALGYLLDNGHFTPQYEFVVGPNEVRMLDHVIKLDSTTLSFQFHELTTAYGLHHVRLTKLNALGAESREETAKFDVDDFDVETIRWIHSRYPDDFTLGYQQRPYPGASANERVAKN